MDQEERQKKLEAGRAKLAHFRQRKAKGDGANPQKKTPKRKSAVHANDLPTQERPLAAKACPLDSAPKRSNGTLAEEAPRPAVDSAQTEPEHEAAPGDEAAVGVCEEEEEPRGALVRSSEKDQRQLQIALEERNEIISQLTANLQVALGSRDQVQVEVMELTNQIQALQQQLQQASEFLRARSQSSAELSQAQQQISLFQRSLQDQSAQLGRLQEELQESQQLTREQQCLLTLKETETTGLLEKLSTTESRLQEALSLRDQEPAAPRNGGRAAETHAQDAGDGADALTERLRAELQAERGRSRGLERLVRDFEEERRALEEQLAEVREELSMEARQVGEEEEELRRELARLNDLVRGAQERLQEEEAAGRRLRAKHEADISNYELRLRSLAEEKGGDREAELQSLRDEVRWLREHHGDRSYQSGSEDPGESPGGAKAQKEHVNQETAGESREEPGLDLPFPSDPDHLMEKYLASVAPRDSTWGEDSLEHSLLENSGNYRFEVDGQVELERPKSACLVQDDNEAAGQFTDMPLPCGQGYEAAEPNEESQISDQWQTHFSASLGPDEGGDSLISGQGPTRSSASPGMDGDSEVVDLGKALLVEQCRDLSAQLEERDRQVEALEGRLRGEAQGASERWSKAAKELESARWELEAEREQRQRWEEAVGLKASEADDLRNQLSLLRSRPERPDQTGQPPGARTADPLLLATGDLIGDLREEKELLLAQLREQERLVRDVQERKLAGDSVTSEVQALFGRQLSALQAHRDGLQAQLDSQKARGQAASEQLGRKALELESALGELRRLGEELEEREGRLREAGEEEADLRSGLSRLEQGLADAEEALSQGAEEQAALRERLGEAETRARNVENTLQTQREEFLSQLRTLKEKESALEAELESARKTLGEQGREQDEAVEAAMAQLRLAHQEELCRLQGQHQEEVRALNLEMERALADQKARLEEEQKKQIALIKQVHEREHQREKAELASRHKDAMEAAHQEHLLQAQAQQTLELEALRLSLTNLHTAQLELSQSNLQRDKEAALSELQASLRDKWAQESAMLQTRQLFELEKTREQCRLENQRELDELKRTWESQISEDRSKMEALEADKIKALKQDWEREAEKAQAEAQATLAETLQALSDTRGKLGQLEQLQASKDQELRSLEEELRQAWSDRDAAARAVEELVSSHNVVLQEQRDRAQHLEGLGAAGTEREEQLQQQLEKLQAEHTAVKQSSEHLWTQLECMRASRQELGELREQLLARSSRVEDMERLKQEFAQQRRDIQEHNEAELEGLRAYFEQRLRAAEEGYRQEIALLQLRLVEADLEDSVLKTGDDSYLSEGKPAEEKNDLIAEITLKLEKHKEEVDALRVDLEGRHRQELEHLRASLSLAYREELLQAKTDLTDRYFSQIQDLKSRHSLELEQQRARLSSSHIKELTKLRGQSAEEAPSSTEKEPEPEVEKEARARLDMRIRELEARAEALAEEHAAELRRVREEHGDLLSQAQEKLKQDCEEELCAAVEEARREERERAALELTRRREEAVAALTEERRGLSLQLEAERERLRALQHSLETERDPQLAAARQEIHSAAEEAKELRARLEERAAADLREARSRLQEEQQAAAEELRLQQSEEHGERLKAELNALEAELRGKHKTELHALEADLHGKHKVELHALEAELHGKHKAELHALEADLHGKHKVELHALEAELHGKHKAELDALEAELHGKHKAELDALEADLHGKHKAELDALEAELRGKHRAQLDALEAELRGKHRAELDALEADLRGKHRAELDALETGLCAKHKAELDSLEAVLQETNLAQLEAQEAELQARHRQEREELEARMLSNMDTLETTYLAEIQATREEAQRELRELRESCDGEREEAEGGRAAELERLGAEHRAQLLSVTEELRRELAQVHMDKFTAMAAELRDAQQAELAQALASQREAVEAEHRGALQTLRRELLALDQAHGAALQELGELRAAEARQGQERQAALGALHQQQLQELRESSARELEEEVSRQRLRLQEEAEKVLQQRLDQLKEELAVEKAAILEECGQKAQVCGETVDQLTKQLQERHAESSQLRAEVSRLRGALQGKSSEMETLETLLQRRERESHEGENLLTMLRADLSTAAQERRGLQKVLLEVLRNTIATEDLISKKISACVNSRASARGDEPHPKATRKGSVDTPEKEEGEEEDSGPDSSLWSAQTDEGLELSQRLSESLFAGAELEAEGEEFVLGACVRLRAAVDKLLELVTESARQLEQTHGAQAHLEERFSQGRQDAAQLVLQHRRVLEQLDLEAGLKSQLELELHKAEGLMEGYVAEKAALEEVLQQKETQTERLVEELEGLRVQLQELSEEHTLLLRQRDAIAGGLGEPEKGCSDDADDAELLREAERLAQEKLDVQRQAEKDRGGLLSRLKLLESELEEQESSRQEQEERRRAHTEDLQQHIQALERQLKHHRQFMDEQAVEREHERDEFQQEIKKLEAQLRHPNKPSAGGDCRGQKIEDLVLQVETLQAAIKEKMEDYNSLLLTKEQYQRDLAEQNEEIDKMAGRIRELEQALLNTSESSRALGQLEQELEKARKTEQELLQDKEALQQQQYSSRLQISALQSKLDEARHRFPESTAEQALKEQLEAVQQTLLNKEKEAEVLAEQLEQVQRDLAVKAEEVLQLHLQLTVLTEQNSICVSQLQNEISSLKETVSELQRRGGGEGDDPASVLQLPLALLEEKNQEIDHLNEQILHLQQEVDVSNDDKAVEEVQAEVEELRSQVERLLGDQARLRQDKEEEVEQLHEVIHKLQEELAQLGPNRHEVSDSQEHSPQPHSFWPPHGQEESLCQELSLQSSRERLDELRAQLDLASGEKEALERLLHTQETTYRGQVEALGQSLAEEKRRLLRLEEEGGALRADLSQREAELERLSSRVRELEDEAGKSDGRLREAELQRDRALADLGKEAELEEELLAVKEEKAQLEQRMEVLLSVKEEKAQLEQRMEVLLSVKEEKAQLEQRMEELQQVNEEGSTAADAQRAALAEQEAKIENLETVKQELFQERQALRQREGRLQEEIERLKQEVTSNSYHIQELNSQLEEKVSRHAEAQKEVLTCAEETLAKAEGALREKEEQLSQLRAEHEALRAELAAVKEGLSSSTERAEKLLEEGQTKDKALANLEVHNQRLKTELRGLQEDLALQEEEVAYQQRELADLRERYSLRGPTSSSAHSHSHCPAPAGSALRGRPEDGFLSLLSHERSPPSPEVLRKLDCSEEPAAVFHASRLSELSGLHNSSLDLHIKGSPVGRASSQPPELLSPELEPPSSCSPDSVAASGSLSALDSLDAQKVNDFEQLGLTPSASPGCSTSTLSAQEWVSDGYGSNVSSELGTRLNVELATTERLDANFLEYLRNRDMDLTNNTDSAADSEGPSLELLSPELQVLLKRVYQEGCRVLALSHRPAPDAPPQTWQTEKRALQETVLSLRELLCKMADKHLKVDGGDADWRRELLQAVRGVFDSEGLSLRSELQALLTAQGLLDPAPLMSQLEQLLRQQEEQQCRSLEQLLCADRRSLLAEVQNLQSQLRISSLQSQEQLQQLHGSLSAAQEEGCQQQHQLRRQVELLEYRLQQEQTCAEDLRGSLSAEQARGAEQRALLRAERDAGEQLKRRLEESGERTSAGGHAQQELQQEARKLRMMLESEQVERQAREEALQREQLQVQQLQEELQQERLRSQRTQDQEGQALEALRSSLEDCRAQITELRGALEQERVLSSNLRMELQIEQSRCEALIAQERSRAGRALEQLEEQRARCAQLTDALTQGKQDHSRRLEEEVAREKQNYARKLEEEVTHVKQNYARKLEEEVSSAKLDYTRKLEEEVAREKQNYAWKLEEEVTQQKRDYTCKLEEEVTHVKLDYTRNLDDEAQQQRRLIVELQAQLEQERRLREEQTTALQRLQEQAAQTKRRLEEEAQQEAGSRLHAAMEGLQSQRQEVARSLEAEKQRAALLQAELDALREKMSSLKEKERLREEQRDRQRRLERQELADKERQQERTSERLQELQQQRAQDQQRVRQLQQTLADLEEKERQLTSQRRHPDSAQPNLPQLRLAQQQLQLAAVKLRSFLHGPPVRREGELAQAEESELRHLLRTLTELDQDLKNLCSQNPSQMSSSSLVERLLKENSDLTNQLATLSEDKVTLKHTVSCLERELQGQRRTRAAREQLKSPEPVDAAVLSEKLAWQKERVSLQTALRKAEAELLRVTAEIENRPVTDGSSSKMARLYGKYLRAESFRKALVYQKKYLLLLLGGFQDCEQVTLSLIARMGAYPSSADLQAAAPRSRPINRFRTSVRVVIAISRLRFLVRKWQKAIRKGPGAPAVANGHGHSGGSGPRAEVLRQQHPGSILNSPPTRDPALSRRGAPSPLAPPVKSPFRLHNRLYPSPALMPAEGSLTQAQDPERSLTEYIQHLEAIQQRLGGMQQVSGGCVGLREPRRQSPLSQSGAMMGYRQKWLRENRTWLYLSCLSPVYMSGLGSAAISFSRKSDR
ncbi:pericentrin isoform X2 [Anguilla rostrata]|uniref:pericentrin isoform X2 n=1 Tax=Anguilla rostrata TaxID=7938 RepID=UPI0030CFD9F6